MKFWLQIILLLSATVVYGQENATEESATEENEASEPKPLASNNSSLEHRDYQKGDFKLNVKLLRAGAHDETNQNHYYFIASLNGFVNTPSERKKDLKDRKKISVDIEKFGEITVASLEFWRAEPKEDNQIQLEITGDMIRELIANTMLAYSVKEDEVSVQMNIEMWEKGKKFFFFGEDKKITQSSFYPIPPTKFDTPARTNLNLEMTDEHGTLVQLAIEYTHPISTAKSK